MLNAPTSCAMANAPVAQGASLDARLEEHESTMGVPYMAVLGGSGITVPHMAVLQI